MVSPRAALLATSRPGRHAWLGLGCDRRGVAVLEFAILGPVLIVLIFAMIDAVWIMTSGTTAPHAPPHMTGPARSASGGLPPPPVVRRRG